MEDDCIYRTAALDFCIPIDGTGMTALDASIISDRLERFLREIPPANVRPVVKGKWIAEPDFLMDVVNRCSVCGEEFVLIDGTPAENNYNYCPNCGAVMT